MSPPPRPPRKSSDFREYERQVAGSGNRMRADGAELWPLKTSTTTVPFNCQGLSSGITENHSNPGNFPGNQNNPWSLFRFRDFFGDLKYKHHYKSL